MKRVLKIFVHDLVGLSRNIFALIIAVGLCIIPSLYAWFNIYSNWDPYANTSSIKVAVVSQDAGYKNSDGKNVNMGDEVLDTLRKNKGLGWQILGTYDEAIDGVKSGKYYAAIVLGEDFSKNMLILLITDLCIRQLHIMKMKRKMQLRARLRSPENQHFRKILIHSLLIL